MTDLMVTHEALAMSSKEIAELTQKRHGNVLRDIRDMLAQVHDLKDNSLLSYEGIQGVTFSVDERTKRVSEIRLDKDHTLTLLTGYDAKARMKVVRRWQELESAQKAPVALPADYLSALKALVASEEAKLALEAQSRALAQQIETEKPYVELARALTGSTTCLTRRDWCALMKSEHGAKFGERALTQWLLDARYIYRDALDKGVPRAYAAYAHLFKLEPERIHGKDRLVLKVTGQGVRELTPKALSHFAAEVV